MSNELFSSIIRNVVTVLLMDCPYELYWYDKTLGSGATNGTLSGNTFSFDFYFKPALEYKDLADLTVDTDKTTAAKNAADNISAIISKYAGKSDLEKLTGYKNEICDLVSYNNSAASDSSTPYGNPWQLIWVFDKDAETNVVCEGYSKAFKYLCDLTTFNSPIYCYLVSGTMNGGAHMWNIVDFGDKTYHVDITNCDSFSSDWLFLKGIEKTATGFRMTYNELNKVDYVFYDDDKVLYADEISRLSTEDYTPPAAISSIAIAESSLSLIHI